MPSARVRSKVGAALAVLGFRGGDNDCWRLQIPNEPDITATLSGTKVALHAPDHDLTYLVNRPTKDDFIPRLRKRLGSLRKKAVRSEKATKRTTSAPAPLKAPSEGFLGGEAARRYDPMAYCERGKHLTRESMMVSENECGDCTGWPLGSR